MITFWWMTIKTNIVFFRIICTDELHIIKPGTFIRRVIRVFSPGFLLYSNYNKRREIVIKYTITEYLTTVTNPELKLLTVYRLSKHSLDTKKARHRQSSLLKEDTLCSCCTQNEMETQLHFWTSRTTHKSATYSILLMQTTIKSIYCACMCNVY